MTWLPIDEVPEEWKDGRVILLVDLKGLQRDSLAKLAFGRALWYDVANLTDENIEQYKEWGYTHAALITPPEGGG